MDSVKIAKNTLSLSGLQIFIKALSVLWTFYLARRLGVASYGLWANILALVSIFGVLQGLGTLNLVVKDVSQDPGVSRKYYGASLGVYMAASILALALIIGSGWALGYSGEKIILLSVAGLSFLCSAPGLASQAILHGHGDFLLYAGIYAMGMILYMVLGGVFVESGHGVIGIFLALCIGYAAMGIVLVWKTVRKYGAPVFEGSFSQARSLVRLGFPLVLSAVLVELILRADRLLITHFRGEAAVGLYHAAFNLVYLPREIVLIPFLTAVYTPLCAHYVKDMERFHRLFEQTCVMLLLVALPIAFIVPLFGTDIIRLLYGEKFLESGKILSILIWMVPPFFLACAWQNILIMLNRTGTYLWTNFSGMAFNVALNLFLIPKWGVVGAAMSAVITQTAMMVLLFWMLRDLSLLGFLKRIHGLTGAAVLAGAFSYLLAKTFPFAGRFSWIAFACAGGALYGLLVWRFKVLHGNEMEWLKARLRFLRV
ncbi:MAG: hypothetical protein A2901_08140 [Elusimicrobia bacterium RIFCSPLOWO2_01_FULL_54_10]|nr:MAG: hypothetical protein A2901_08140 [Elusimicrobia bacterium RIFCSPLOWO2_01_FULL_54_10]